MNKKKQQIVDILTEESCYMCECYDYVDGGSRLDHEYIVCIAEQIVAIFKEKEE